MALKSKFRRLFRYTPATASALATSTEVVASVEVDASMQDQPALAQILASKTKSAVSDHLQGTPANSAPSDAIFQPVEDSVVRAKLEHGAAGRLGNKSEQVGSQGRESWETAKSTWDLLTELGSGLKTLGQAIGGAGEGPIIEATAIFVGAIAKPIIKQDARDGAFEDLLTEMIRTYKHVQDELSWELPVSVHNETKLLGEISRLTASCAQFIQHEYITKGFWARSAKNALRGDHVDETIEKFRRAFVDLLESLRDTKLKFLEATVIIGQLRRSPTAGRRFDNTCLPKTRVQVLRALSNWVQDPGGARAMILIGVAGSGKSCIAHTIASQMEAEKMLGAFFAFDRSDTDRVPTRVLGTIAHDLAMWNEGYRDVLVQQLKARPSLAETTDIQVQWERLVAAPATSLSSIGPVLLVVDAFDECPGSPDDRSRQTLLDLLISGVSRLPANVRLLVTSRAESDVLHASRSITRIDLGDVETDADIRLYVRTRLPGSVDGGLDDVECENLAVSACGLFQWAATACSFLEQKRAGTNMHKRFTAYRRQLMRGDIGLEGGRPSLGVLYRTVLEVTLDVTDEEVMHSYRIALSLVLCATTPLSMVELQTIHSLAERDQNGALSSVLRSMGSLLSGAANDSSPMRPLHQSFIEFLLDGSRSGPWHIRPADLAAGHRTMALGTLNVLEHHLPSQLHPVPASGVADIPDQSQLAELTIGLSYSAQNWARHLACTTLEPDPQTVWLDAVRLVLQDLLYNKLHLWTDLLTALSRTDVIPPSLQSAADMFTGHHEVREFILDTRRIYSAFPFQIDAP